MDRPVILITGSVSGRRGVCHSVVPSGSIEETARAFITPVAPITALVAGPLKQGTPKWTQL